MRSTAILAFCAAMLALAGWINSRLAAGMVAISPIVSRDQVPRDTAKQGASVIAADGAPKEDVAEALLRPLFHPDRRPFVPVEAPPSEEPVDEAIVEEPDVTPTVEPAAIEIADPKITLLGVILGGAEPRALLAVGEASGARWMSRGDRAEGWRLADIDGESVAFEREERRIVATLYRDREPPSGTSP